MTEMLNLLALMHFLLGEGEILGIGSLTRRIESSHYQELFKNTKSARRNKCASLEFTVTTYCNHPFQRPPTDLFFYLFPGS